MIRITGGKFKGKQLKTISKYVRPTSSLKREAFFSVIESYGLRHSNNFFGKKTFLDLFAGLGTMGLEAISRDFKHVIFYENNIRVLNILKKNCANLCKDEQFEIIEEDIETAKIELKFKDIGVVFLDPPYNKYNITNILLTLQNKISDDTIIGVESSIKDSFKVPDKLKLLKQKRYGKTNLSFLVLT